MQSENALLCRSLLKERIDFWNQDLSINIDSTEENFIQVLLSQECNDDNLVLSPDSAEVAFTIAGYIAKKLKKRLSCNTCSNNLVESSTDCSYFLHLFRGGLTCPSAVLAELVCKEFALLDFHDSCIISQSYLSTRHGALCMLRHYLHNYQFLCDGHLSKGLEILFNIMVNIFYNNKQKIVYDSICKDQIIEFKRKQREKPT